jgi:hypothetical protein
MPGGIMKSVVRVAVLAAVFAGCAEEPLGYEYAARFSLSVLQGGANGVYFLPPLLQSWYEGEFAPDREPVVVICAGAPATPCASPVAQLDMVLDAGEDESQVVRVSMEDEHYIVNWHALGLPHGLYRIFVTEGGATQAFIDVVLTRGGRGIRAYGADDPRPFNGTLPITFRMEVRDVVETGLLAQYYDWSNTAPDFNEAALILERVDPVVDFDDPTGAADVFAIGQNDRTMVRWTGSVVAERTAFYTFCITTEDGVRFWINDILFVNSWVDRGITTECRSWSMEEGTSHAIRLESYHRTGATAARLYWQTPADAERQIIPTSALSPS